jgi:hypothetical protein
MLNFENEKGSTTRQDIATRYNQFNDRLCDSTPKVAFSPSKSMIIALQQPLIKKLGLDAAVMLSQSLYWQKKMGNKFWYKTQKDWETEIGLSRRQQERARSTLRDLKPQFWHEKYAGSPRRLYFKVDLSVFAKMTLLNNQVSAEMTDLPVANELTGMSDLDTHIRKLTNRNNQGDFSKATTGIDAFMSRHLKNEVIKNA